MAGAVAAKYLAPAVITKIGVLGTGVQARLQLNYLRGVTTCRDVIVWGRNEEKLKLIKNDLEIDGFTVETTMHASRVVRNSNFLITTTASAELLIRCENVLPGTHITAVGADSYGKQGVGIIFDRTRR